MDFLNELPSVLQSRFSPTTVDQCLDPAGRLAALPVRAPPPAHRSAALSWSTVAVAAYRWLVCFLLEKSQKRLEELRAEGQDEFQARNNSQVARCRRPGGLPPRG